MAQSKRQSFRDDIKKELECPVCQEQYSESNRPKVLKCQHTFCKSCLEGWLRQQGGGRLSCPNCREITECSDNEINSLPTNFAYNNLGDILKAHSGSDGGHDFESKEENVCKRHNEKVKFYCEQCEIFICSECAIVDHRDRNYHNIMSLKEGTKRQKAIIEEKMEDFAANTSRLRSYTVVLTEERARINGNIEEAAKEVHRVAGDCINSIRQHEACVTELLTKKKSSYDEDLSKQLSKLSEKLKRMDHVSALCRDVLQGNHPKEMLNIKEVLDEMIAEKVMPPQLKYPNIKYTPNEETFAPGKLHVTYTGLSKGIQAKEGNFTASTNAHKMAMAAPEVTSKETSIYRTENGVDISLRYGDISSEKVDAILNPSDDFLSHGAGLAKVIVQKGGSEIQRESVKLIQKRGYKSLHIGDAVHTRAGNLPCKFVIHAVGPTWGKHSYRESIKLLQKACSQSLKLASKLGLSSIAIPAISSGIFGAPADVCAFAMLNAVEEYLRTVNQEPSKKEKPSKTRKEALNQTAEGEKYKANSRAILNDIRFVLIDADAIDVFEKEFIQRFGGDTKDTTDYTEV